MEPDDGLQPIRIDTRDLADDAHLHILRLVFWNRHIGRGMVLLVTHQYVRHQWALAWQERNRKFHSLAMPVFTIFPIELDSTNGFIELVEKSELRAHAKVGHSKEAQLFKNELPRQLDLDCR